MKGYHDACGGYHEYDEGVQYPHSTHDIPPPMYHDIPHGTQITKDDIPPLNVKTKFRLNALVLSLILQCRFAIEFDYQFHLLFQRSFFLRRFKFPKCLKTSKQLYAV